MAAFDDMVIRTLCKHCNKAIVPTAGRMYPWTHEDPDQDVCFRPEPKLGARRSVRKFEDYKARAAGDRTE